MHLSLDTFRVYSIFFLLEGKNHLPLLVLILLKKILSTKDSINFPGILQKLETPIPEHFPLARHNCLTYCFAISHVSEESVFMSWRLSSLPSFLLVPFSQNFPWSPMPWPAIPSSPLFFLQRPSGSSAMPTFYVSHLLPWCLLTFSSLHLFMLFWLCIYLVSLLLSVSRLTLNSPCSTQGCLELLTFLPPPGIPTLRQDSQMLFIFSMLTI